MRLVSEVSSCSGVGSLAQADPLWRLRHLESIPDDGGEWRVNACSSPKLEMRFERKPAGVSQAGTGHPVGAGAESWPSATILMTEDPTLCPTGCCLGETAHFRQRDRSGGVTRPRVAEISPDHAP